MKDVIRKDNMIDLIQSGMVFSTSFNENAELFTTNLVIAKYAGINVRSVNRVINKYMDYIVKKFGEVRFKITPSKKNGSYQKTKIFELTEDQATFTFTLLRNTKRVVDFKARLVKAFSKSKKLLNQRLLAHETSKPLSKLISNAIHDNPKLDDKAYLWINNLVIKLATSKTVHQVRKERNAVKGHSTNEYLTVDERNRVDAVKNILLGLIKFGLGHDEIIEFVHSPMITSKLTIKQPELSK